MANDQGARIALRVIDWAAARAAEAIVRHAGGRIVQSTRRRVVQRVPSPRLRRAVAAPVLPRARKQSMWRAPFMGTSLTRGGAAMTFAVAPVFWIVADLAWAALPA